MRSPRHLVVFLRAPRLGRVKSRLAAGIGASAALGFYRMTSVALLRRLSRDRRWICHLAVTPDRALAGPRPWRVDARYRGQGQGDLGQRMARVFRTLPAGPAVIIGSDIPDIVPAHIAAAFRAVGHHDAVFGPARDGGYWLVGLRRSPRVPQDLFKDVRWSSEHALADTLASLPPDFAVARLATLDDIDDAAGYARWRAALNRSRRASGAPEAAA
jgi:hypothetical protein